MGTIRLKIPDSLHARVRELAKQDNVSINQFITLALAEKISVLGTETYLADRAKRGSRRKVEAALAQVPDVEPDEVDRL